MRAPDKQELTAAAQNGKSSTAASHDEQPVRVNVRFLLLSLVILLVFSGVGYGLHHFQVQRSAKSLLHLADEANNRGETKEAVQYLAQYIRFRPADYDAKIRMADWLQTTSKTTRTARHALAILEEVLRNVPDHPEADRLRRRAVSLALSLNRPRDALAHVEILQDTRSDDFELQTLKGRCYEQLGDYPQAMAAYLRAIQTSPQTVDGYVRLADAIDFRPENLPRRGDLAQKKIVTRDGNLLTIFPLRNADPTGDSRPADDPRKKLTRAETVITKIYELLILRGRPKHSALLARAAWHRRKNKFDLAERDLAAALAAAPQAYEVLFQTAELAAARAEQAFLEFKAEEMRRQLDRAMVFALRGKNLSGPDRLRFYPQLARIAQLIAKFSDDPAKRDRNQKLATRYVQDGLKQLAVLKGSRKSDDADKDGLDLIDLEIELRQQNLEILSADLTDENGANPEKQKEYAEELRKLAALGAPPVRLALFTAQQRLAQREWREALTKLVPVRRSLRQAVTWRRRIDDAIALCYRQLNDPTGEVRIFKDGLEVDSLWHRGRLQLAKALVLRGHVEEAMNHYRFLVRHRIAEATLELIRLQIERLAAKPPQSRDFTAVYANLDLASEAKLDEASIAILRAQARLLDGPTIIPGRMLSIQKLLDDVIARNPNDGKLRAARAKLEIHRPDLARDARIRSALRVLDAAERTLGHKAILLIARAEIAANGDAATQIKLLKEVSVAAEKLPRSEQIRVLRAVARSYAALKQFRLGRTTWNKVAGLSPGNLQSRLASAELAIRLGDRDGLQQDLASIRAIEGAGGPWGNYLEASGLIAGVEKRMFKGDKKPGPVARDELPELSAEDLQIVGQAQRLLNHAARLRSQWPEIPHQLGRIEALLGNRHAAYKHYRRAISLGDSSTEALYHCTALLIEEQQFLEARELFKLAERRMASLFGANQVNLTDRHITLAELRLKLELESGDLQGVQKLLAQHSQDFRQKILLAMVKVTEYESLKEKEKAGEEGQALLKAAEKLHKEAIQLSPNVPEPWVSYVAFLTRLGRVDDAEKIVVELQRLLPAGARDVTAARCYAVLGNAQKAERHFLHAVHAKLDDPAPRLRAARFYTRQGQRDKALAQLNVILDPKSNATDSQRKAARHLKVLAVASRGRYADIQEALTMLKPAPEAKLEELRIHVAVLRRSPLKRDHRALIDVLELIRKKEPLSPGDAFLLARLYHSEGRWKQTQRVIDVVLSSFPKNPRLLAWYAAACLKKKDDAARFNQATRLFQRLKAAEPGSMRTALTEARLLLARKNSDEAGRVLEGAVSSVTRESGGALTASELSQLLSAAEWCEAENMPATAERILRVYVSFAKEREAMVSLANFLGRQGRYADGLKICLASQGKCEPAAVAVTAVNVVSLGEPGQAHLAEAESIVQAALKKEPNSARILAAYASLLSAQGRTSQSELLYRQILKRYPDSVVVLNNLAWLLAVQNQQLANALELVNSAIKNGGPLATFLDTRALILMKMGKHEAAITDLQQAMKEEPSPTVRLHLAQAMLQSGQDADAMKALRAAMREGLSLQSLHRLEQPAYRSLVNRLNLTL